MLFCVLHQPMDVKPAHDNPRRRLIGGELFDGDHMISGAWLEGRSLEACIPPTVLPRYNLRRVVFDDWSGSYDFRFYTQMRPDTFKIILLVRRPLASAASRPPDPWKSLPFRFYSSAG